MMEAASPFFFFPHWAESKICMWEKPSTYDCGTEANSTYRLWYVTEKCLWSATIEILLHQPNVMLTLQKDCLEEVRNVGWWVALLILHFPVWQTDWAHYPDSDVNLWKWIIQCIWLLNYASWGFTQNPYNTSWWPFKGRTRNLQLLLGFNQLDNTSHIFFWWGKGPLSLTPLSCTIITNL